MRKLSQSYEENTMNIATRLRVNESFDLIERKLKAVGGEVTFFYVDGFVKDGEMQRIMQFILSAKQLSDATETLLSIPYVEVEITSDEDKIVRAVLSGQTAMLAEGFFDSAILIDARTYPARQTGEPDSDRVMQGSHDGFVETLVVNTALIRRRIRDERLTMTHFDMGGASKTDVVLCYMTGVADPALVEKISRTRICSCTILTWNVL